jgi:hypothetical protein
VLVCAVLICKVFKAEKVLVLLQLRHADSLRTKRKGNDYHGSLPAPRECL